MAVLLSVILLTASTAFAQGERTYTVDPSVTYKTTTPVLDEITKFYIHFKNTTGKELNFGWKKLSMDIPTGWDYSLCDLGICYAGIPDGEHSFVIEKDSSGFLAPNLFPDNITGTATIQMAVWDVDHPTVTDTLTWIITAKPQSDVKINIQPSLLLRLNPNPATDDLSIDLGTVSSGTIQVVTITGATILNHSITNTQTTTIDLSSYTPGTYLVIFRATDGSIAKTSFVKN